MASAIASSRRLALLRVCSTCAFHILAVIATAPEQITAIRVTCVTRESDSRVNPYMIIVGRTKAPSTMTMVIATPLRPNCRPSQIAGKATAIPIALPSEIRKVPRATMSSTGSQIVQRLTEPALADRDGGERGDQRRSAIR